MNQRSPGANIPQTAEDPPDARPLHDFHRRRPGPHFCKVWFSGVFIARLALPRLASAGGDCPASPVMRGKLWCLWLLWLVGGGSAAVQAESRVELGPWSGAITATSAVVKVKMRTPGQPVVLLVENHSRPEPLRRFGPFVSTTNDHRVVAFQLRGLTPATRYRYVVSVNGQPEPAEVGSFQTFPIGAASFRFAFASCGKTGSTNASYDRIREHKPLFFLCPGDFHYEDITTNRVDKFWRAYDKVFASKVQARLYRQIPLVYMWDDHDYCGNGSDDRATGRPAARAAYQLYAPHYPLPFDGHEAPISQAFSVGRTRFIITDLRSQRDAVSAKDTESKSMLGTAQKAWLKEELLAARDTHAVIFWVSSVPWNGTTRTNLYWPVTTNDFGYIHHSRLAYNTNNGAKPSKPSGGDSWAWYASERREISDFLRDQGIRNLVLLHGDMHALAADNGSNSDFATGGGAPIPLFAAAPLDREASIKAGPYSEGLYKPRKGEGCFGLVDVQDTGSRVVVRFSGRSNDDIERIHLTLSYPLGR